MKGFTLIELLVVIVILAVLSAIVMLILNPLELAARNRDAARLADLANIRDAININLQESSNSGTNILCYNTTTPCTARSDATSSNIRLPNGAGWVKVDISGNKSFKFAVLPTDPLNTSAYHYTYYSDGVSWEINASLESNQFKNKTANDGGDNNDTYEVGTKFNLVP